MDITYFLLLIQVLNFILIITWIVLAVLAFLRMRTANLSDSARVIWVLLIFFVPVAGAAAFLIAHPRSKQPSI